MASTVSFTEYNGATPTATAGATDINLTNTDSSGVTYSSYPITAGNNSYSKYQAAVHAGTYNVLSAASYKISNNQPATNVNIMGSVVTAYTLAATTATGDSLMSTTGLTANFGTSTTPFTAGTTTYSTSGTVYVNALRLQLQTTTNASPGDTSSVTVTYTWTET